MYPAFQVCQGALDTSRHGWRLAVDNATITASRSTMLAAMSRRECSKNRNMYVWRKPKAARYAYRTAIMA
jgi:hypothetical protein